MSDSTEPRCLSLLYQLYVANSESRRFMRLALRDTGMSGEEYGIYSYFFANGARTLTQAAADLGYPVTTLASLLAPIVEGGELVRRSHPQDRRARLLELTEAGRERLARAIPAFSRAYDALTARLAEADADTEELFAALATIRSSIARTNELLEAEAGDHVSR